MLSQLDATPASALPCPSPEAFLCICIIGHLIGLPNTPVVVAHWTKPYQCYWVVLCNRHWPILSVCLIYYRRVRTRHAPRRANLFTYNKASQPTLRLVDTSFYKLTTLLVGSYFNNSPIYRSQQAFAHFLLGPAKHHQLVTKTDSLCVAGYSRST